MRWLILFLILLISLQTAQALTINVQGDCTVGHKLTITTDKPALLILRLNNGTPIYANSTAYFTPQVVGILRIEALAGNEKAVKVVEIRQPAPPPDNDNEDSENKLTIVYLPSGTTTITLEDGSTANVNWRTALGALIKASQIKRFSIKVKKWAYGLFVDCIDGYCTGDLGSSSGWMYVVNGEIPSVSADQYALHNGDTVVWYFSRSMNETPESSPYKIKIKVKFCSYESKKERGDYENKGTIKRETKFIVNLTRIPLVVVLKTGEPVKIKLKKEKPAGLKFNKLYAYVLDCFDLKVNRSTNVTVSFTIPKENLTKLNASPKDVFLAEYNGTWIYLPTNFTENETHYIFTVNLTNFSLFAVVIKWHNFPLKPNDPAIVRALNWLRQEQRADGGWGSLSNTSWVIMALVSAGENPYNWTKNGRNPVDYFKANLNESVVERMGTSDFARTILALIALNQNPYDFNGINFVEKLKERVKEDGQIGDYIYTTIWGILALKACGENVSKSVEWLKEHQNPDGGFAWAVGAESDFDDTASAIQALIAGGVSRDDPVIKKALNYLKRGQCEDGGMKYFGNSSSNADSDAWTIQALVSACVNPMEWKTDQSVVEHLLSLQAEDGHFKYTKYVTSIPIKVTADAVMALLGKPHPVKVLQNKTFASPIKKRHRTPTTTTVVTTIPTTITVITQPTTTTTKEIAGFKAVLVVTAFVLIVFYRKFIS